MLKQEITEKITKYFMLTSYEAESIYDDIFKYIGENLKKDNVAEVINLGEFILKYDSSTNEKSIEFLPSSDLEESISSNIGNMSFMPSGIKEEIKKSSQIESTTKPDANLVEENAVKEPENVPLTPEIKEEVHEEKEKAGEQKTPGKIVTEEPEKVQPEQEKFESTGSVEDDMKIKREKIIHKLDPQHQEAYHPLLHVTTGIPLNVPKPVVLPERETKKATEEIKNEEKPVTENEIKTGEEAPLENQHHDVHIKEEEISKEQETVNELSSKSFSDYFREVKEEQKPGIETKVPPVIPVHEQVVPPAAVDLHKDIVGEVKEEPVAYNEPQNEPVKTIPVTGQGANGFNDEKLSKNVDQSYYIWYKDSEPNPIDTQTMSYEYELLYQATKEAEYKSKLKIYVTTFILFFSIVLILLIFSPVIYKYFFTGSEVQVNTETLPEEQQQPPVVNEQQQNNEQQTQQQNNEQQNQQQSVQTEQNTQNQQTTQTQNVEGLTKIDIGWIDDKNKVVYVQLENGKYAIQESSWDSEDKANKRISKVGSFNITGMTGSFVKADLGAKGIWYRVRFGEFPTIDEAREKAGLLRKKGL